MTAERARRPERCHRWTSELNTAVHLQGADDIAEVGRGRLEPGGQLVLTLKKGTQGATKSDVADLAGRLQRIENLLTAPR
jgi:uncharacterized membrane protein YcaP (DUF421 family)